MSIKDALSEIHVPYLMEVIAFLLGVVIIVPLFKRIKINPIVGFLALGALIGPHTLAVVKDIEGIRHFAELGVIFLLFTIGLELSLERLRAYSGLIFGLGTAQVVVCAVGIGLVAFLWGNSPQAAIIIGLCLSLSSTAMVVQLLSERGEMGSQFGRASFSILLFQDLAVVPILILVTVFGSGGGSILTDIGYALLNAVIAISAILVAGRFGLRKFFEIASRTKSIDVFTAMTLLTILVISLITGIAGLSMALGAFLAGLLLAETEFRHQIESEIEPFKGLFLCLFFMSVGMNIDFAIAFENGIWLGLSVVGLLGLKAALIFISSVTFKFKPHDAIRISMYLAQGGEFAFVVIGQATTTFNIIENNTGQFMIVVAGISMMLTPIFAGIGERLSEMLQPSETKLKESNKDEHIHDHVVIAGFGRAGQTVANVLNAEAIPYIAVESNADSVKALRESYPNVYVGDAARVEILKRAGIERAAVLLITINDPEYASRTLAIARQHWPDLRIIVRSRDNKHAQALLKAGACEVVPEALEASLQLSGYTLRAIGFTHDEASHCINLARKATFQHTI